MTPLRGRRLVLAAILTVTGLYPVILLFGLGTSFYVDWTNDAWFAGYTGEYLSKHFAFPAVFVTHQYIGMPFPTFYGFLLFPIAGLIGAFFGGDVSVRIICVSVMLGQTFAIYFACRSLGLERFYAYTIAALFAFRPYALTNLYNRSDLTEYISFCLVVIGLALATMYWRKRDQDIRALSPGLFMALAIGTSPLGGALGVVGFAAVSVIVLLTNRGQWRRCVVIMICNFLIAAIILSPWLAALFRYRAGLYIVNAAPPSMNYYEFDALANHLLPFPFDARSLIAGVQNVSTPYLDVQNAVPLLIFAIGGVVVQRRDLRSRLSLKLALLGLAAAFAILLISSQESIGSHLTFLRGFQVAYRLTNLCDLALLFSACAALKGCSPPKRGDERVLAMLGVGCLVMGSLSVAIKFTHAQSIEQPQTISGLLLGGDRSTLLTLPSTFVAPHDYMSLQERADLGMPTISITIPLADAKDFGMTGETPAPATGLAVTNIQAFPWNHVTVDGREVETIQTGTQNGFVTVRVRKNERIGYVLLPVRSWLVFRVISGFTLTIMIVLLIAAPFSTSSRSRVAGKLSAARD